MANTGRLSNLHKSPSYKELRQPGLLPRYLHSLKLLAIEASSISLPRKVKSAAQPNFAVLVATPICSMLVRLAFGKQAR